MNLTIRRGDNAETLQVVDFVCSNASYSMTVVYAAALVGPVQSVVAARAMVSNDSHTIQCPEIGPGLCFHSKEGDTLNVKVSKLPRYNSACLVVRTSSSSVVMGSKYEAISNYLMGPNIDTPIIKPWLPWLVDSLVDGRFVTQLNGTLEAWYCDFKSATVDALVSKGIVAGKLKFAAPNKARLRA